jgi:hypothetical protein
MGLLDDAIRDHLDLKRRHGADPAELERAEREALGPVRRKGDVAAGYADDDVEAAAPFDLDEDDAPAASRPFAYDQAAEDDWDHPPEGGATAVEEAPDVAPEADFEPPRRSRRSAAPEPEAEEDDDQPRGLAARFGLRGRRSAEDDHDDEPDFDEPALGEDEPTRVHRTESADRTPAPTGGETAEYDVDEALHPERTGDEDDDDMLEETPEFLQDTPDHDRLWFEQKPPRDFDFDG